MSTNSENTYLNRISTFLIGSLFAVGLLSGCSHASKNKPEDTKSSSSKNPPTKTAIVEGKKLSKIYCGRCHTYPPPRLLDKHTWVNQTLPNMGPRLGIFEHNGVKYPLEKTTNLPKNLYPDTALISQENWQKILDYFHTAAPEILHFPPPAKKIRTDPLFFDARTPHYQGKTPPMVSAIRFDPSNKMIYLSDAATDKFMVFNHQLDLTDHLNVTSALSDIEILNKNTSSLGKRDLLLTYIGSLSPSDALKGSVMRSSYNPQNKKAKVDFYVRKRVDRPVQSQMADLDQDGNSDYLINAFGHRKGQLYWLKNGQLSKKHILTDTPGCIKSIVTDFNGDRRPDVIALCTQMTEALYLFQNQGNGTFSPKILIQFPVVYGSSSFELHDFNNDGKTDVLYTGGDNSDYSTIFKPYHGVYIYLNQGNGRFKKAWFYHINGAYNAKARDFDHDGDLDIAAIAFFANYQKKPQEGFVFFQNDGNLSFTPYHPPATSMGRWITMDVADWTGNGYDDILLGNFSLGPTKVVPAIKHKFTHGPEFLLLENHAGEKNL